MAESDKKADGKKAEKGAKPDKTEKAAKAPAKDAAAAKGGKPDKGDKPAKGKKDGAAAAAETVSVNEPRKPARLKVHYESVIKKRLTEEFSYKNLFEVPRLDKVVINMGVGEGAADRKKVEQAAEDLALISGQKAIITIARKSIASFKLREGQPVGCKVTLRKARMYEFIDRLINIALPRMRDFRGLSAKSFDGQGNYTLGIREHIVFPEIDYDKVDSIWGLDVIVCTTATDDDQARALLKGFNFPFRN